MPVGNPLRRGLSSALDTALDLTVVGGYTTVGYQVRRRLWDRSELPRLDGKTVLVTGATSGIGLAAAQGMARLGATVWLVARDQSRGEAARDQIIESTGNGNVHVGLCDLSSIGSVRAFCARLSSELGRLDVLVNNAGVLTSGRRTSVDGIELTLATNVIGPFLLTELLVPILERSAPARVINVSSGGMYAHRINVQDLEAGTGSFDGAAVYARSKRGEVILTELWAERLDASDVVVHAMHPGWVDTAGLRSSLPRFRRLTGPLLRTAQQGADTIVWLAAAAEPAASTGGFWHDRRPRPKHLLPWTRETAGERELLWKRCLELSGGRNDEPSTGH